MAANVTRNAFKGYTYQQYIYCLLLAKMDTSRCFLNIDAEVDVNHNFDDIKLTSDKITYYIQAKNYPDTEFTDIKISNEQVIIKGNTSSLSTNGINIVFINTSKLFPTNSKIVELDAFQDDNLFILGLDSHSIQGLIEGMFQTSTRADAIIFFAYNRCISGKFNIKIDELPCLSVYSTKLEEETIYIRQCIDTIDKGILCIQGKPGVGKSHFSEEIVHIYPDAIIYRFWIGSQDVNVSQRRNYNNFLNDIALKIYKTPRSFTEEELIEKINCISPIIIIDGLDHIENYNISQLDDYIKFINSINNARVIILTRPLTHQIDWPTITLGNWNREQTLTYLFRTFSFDYATIIKIYELTDGHPIIAKFCAEHFQKYNSLSIEVPVTGLDEYYENLMGNVHTKNALSIFLLTSSFFTDKEISYLTSEFYGDMLPEYINSYPYLFERNVNRVSLIHDSLNTFLRNKVTTPIYMKDRVLCIIKSSIKRNEIEYLSRFGDINFDDEMFINGVFQQYSDFHVFKNLLKNNIDFESIKEFYLVLKILLEEHPNVLNIFQYYCFILICLIIERNDFVGMQGLMYNHLIYLIRTGIDENSIFSSGIFWATYRIVKYEDTSAYLRPFYKFYYDLNSQVKEFREAKNQSDMFFELFSKDVNIEKTLLNLSSINSDWDKRQVLVDIICYSFIRKLDEHLLFSIVNDYTNNVEAEDCEYKIWRFTSKYINDDLFKRDILPQVKAKLESLGYLRENNIYLKFTLNDLILNKAKNGSFDVYPYVENYLRLANHEKRIIDIENIWKIYYMYFNRKDYSVISLIGALLTFQKHGMINEEYSLHLIRNVMLQSEKGIRHLLNEYINAKEDDFVLSCREYGLYQDDRYSYDIFQFSVPKINLLSKQMIYKRMVEELRYHQYGKTNEFNDIQAVLHSKYQYLIIEMIRQNGYSLFQVSEDEFLSISGIKAVPILKDKDTEYIPLEHGNIHIEDIEYIKRKKLSSIEISRFTDGWYSCFAIPEIYEHFPKQELQDNLYQIIHTSMFAKSTSLERIGSWERYLGHLPKFLDYIGSDVDWSKLFETFISFIDMSLIPYDYFQK